ncbi:MAG: hypothetical protein K2K60_06190 [Clostridia bacterium]|nr:hypothetical protein [Clostridia bacterium]
MKIKFLGTGAAEGVPAMFCSCDYCRNIRSLGEREYRTRSQVLIDGNVSVDFPPEAYAHSLKFGIELSDLKTIFVTHSHMDHFYAHDFILRGYKYARLGSNVLNIYGNSEVKKVFDECTAREMKPEVSPHISVTEVKPFQVFNADGYRVITIPANHSKTEDALLYYIEKDGKGYLHLYDTGRVSDKSFDFLAQNGAKANLVCFDCTFVESVGGENSRHMGIEDDMLMKQKLLSRGIIDNNTKLVISHFSHNSNPMREKLAHIEKQYAVIAAYDGYETEI